MQVNSGISYRVNFSNLNVDVGNTEQLLNIVIDISRKNDRPP